LIDEIATILIDEIEIGIATPMWTDDEKIGTGETLMIAMMICEGNSETEEIETEMMTEGETEMMTEEEIGILMVTGDVKTGTGGIVMTAMTTCGAKIETGEIVTTAMMTYEEN